jgi:hypothetical protein
MIGVFAWKVVIDRLFPFFFSLRFLLSHDHFATTKLRKGASQTILRPCSIFIQMALSYCEMIILGLFAATTLTRITFEMINFTSGKYETQHFP